MSSQQRAPAEDYFPSYVRKDAELDYCYGKCRCGWETEAMPHPESVKYEIDIHIEHVNDVDCSLPETKLIFEDGTEATIK